MTTIGKSVLADGIAILPEPLWLELGAMSCLEISIRSQKVILAIPEVPANPLQHSSVDLTEPRFNDPSFQVTTSGEAINWGNFNQSSKCSYVRALRFMAPMDVQQQGTGFDISSNRPFDWLRDGWVDWFEIFSAWLLAWRLHPRIEQPRHNGIEIVSAAENLRLGFKGSMSADVKVLNLGTLRGSSAKEVQSAIHFANSLQQLPVPNQMLLRSITALTSGRFRESLVDACTAAEAALLASITQNSEKPLRRRQDVEKKVGVPSGIMALSQQALDDGFIGKSLLDAVRRHVASPRNSAVHAGSRTSEKEARKALKIAKELCELVCPIPLPGSQILNLVEQKQ